MNARLDALPLAHVRLAREQVGLQIERKKLDRRKAEIAKLADILADGQALRLLLLDRFDALEQELTREGEIDGDEWQIHATLTEAVFRTLHQAADALANYGGSHQQAAAKGLRPRRHLTVTEWADAKRVLKTGTANPGPWRTSFVPYLREIQDALSAHSPVTRIVFMKSAQVAGTECGLNWLGYVMDHAPAEMLHVMPSLDLRKRFHIRRFTRLLTETDCLAALFGGDPKRSSGNSEDLTVFPGGTLIKAGANSPNSLRSDAVRNVFCDEVDGFQWDVGGEGDPLELIENRQRTYSRRKLFLVSTPTLAETSRIEREYRNSDRRRYHVACPHCGELQPLEFGGKDVPHGLKWSTNAAIPKDAASATEPIAPRVTHAWYVCRENGCIIEEHHKPAMLMEQGHGGQARWVPEDPRNPTRGYHINALYSPIGMGERWAGIAQKFLDAQGDDAKLKTFINTYLGQTWTEDGHQADPAALISRLEDYEFPDKSHPDNPILAIFIGADVQKDRIEFTAIGLGLNEEAWVLDHQIIPGDTAQPEVWRDFEAATDEFTPHGLGIDSGYNTSMVYAYVETHRSAVALKGMDGPHRPLVEDKKARARRLRGQRRKGIMVHIVGTDQAKGLIHSRLNLAKPGPGYIHFPNTTAFDPEYFAQLGAERLVIRMKNGRRVHEWVQLRPRNEALDCLVYAYAAYYLSNIDLSDLARQRREASKPKPAPARALPAKSTGGNGGNHGFY